MSRQARPSRRRGQAGYGRAGLLATLVLLVAAAGVAAVALLLARPPSGGTSSTSPTTASPSTQGATPSPGTSATASPSPTGSATSEATPGPVQTADALFPASGSACGDSTGDYATCPVSPRMEQKLTTLYAKASRPYSPLCRCSRSWSEVAVTQAGSSTVDVDFTFSGTKVTMVVSMIPGAGGVGWVADDTSCAGADLYSSQYPPACWAPG